jgi:hypothetical protein
MRCVMYLLVVCLLRTNTFALFCKWHDVLKKKLLNKKCVMIFSRIYAEKILIVSRINRNITINIVRFSRKGKIILVIFNKSWASSTRCRKVAGSIPDGVMEFYIDLVLRAALWPWGRHSLKQKRVPVIFPEGLRRPLCTAETWPPSCADCHEIWEPQRPGTLGDSTGLYRDCLLYLKMGRAAERGTSVSVMVVWELWGGNWKWKNDGMERG